MRKKRLMTKTFHVALVFFGLFTFIGCMLNTSGLAPVPATPTDPYFHGCFERIAAPSGSINICQGSGDQLDGSGSGLFGDNFNDLNTVLLIQGNTDITTDITDVAAGSTPPKMITPNGNARSQNALWKFGGGSISFYDGSGDYLSIPDNPDFNFSDGTWTIDTWIYNNADTVGRIFYQQTDADNYISLYNTNSTLYFRIARAGSDVVSINCPAGALSDGAWHHVALVENGDSYVIYIDGVSAGSSTVTVRPVNYTGTVYIGSLNGSSGYLNAYLDEFRVSKVARWTTDFTPPTEEWRELEWGFTGTVTGPGRATLHITTEEDPERIFDVEAWNPLVGGAPDRTRLRIRRDGTTYELPTTVCLRFCL